MPRNRRKRLAEINVVPYIDVMLVLLIIFMVTAPMLTQGLTVELPTSKAQALSNDDNLPIIATVNKDGKYYLTDSSESKTAIDLNNLIIRVRALKALAERANKPFHLLIKGDKAVQYERVVYLMGALKASGIDKVGLVTKLPDNIDEGLA